MRLVLDTNVLISALLKPGSVPDRLLVTIALRGALVLYDARVAREYREVLRLTSPPPGVQTAVLGPLAVIARLSGRDPRADWLHGPGSPSRAASGMLMECPARPSASAA